LGERSRQRQALAQYGGAGQRLGAAAGDSGDGRSELSGDGSIHDLAVPLAGAACAARR
jgi:hypothetical protein